MKTEHLIADEFSAELADGVAYVSGNDDEGRPVLVYICSYDSFFTLLLLFFEFVFSLIFSSSFYNKLILSLDFPHKTGLPQIPLSEIVSATILLRNPFSLSLILMV